MVEGADEIDERLKLGCAAIRSHVAVQGQKLFDVGVVEFGEEFHIRLFIDERIGIFGTHFGDGERGDLLAADVACWWRFCGEALCSSGNSSRISVVVIVVIVSTIRAGIGFTSNCSSNFESTFVTGEVATVEDAETGVDRI